MKKNKRLFAFDTDGKMYEIIRGEFIRIDIEKDEKGKNKIRRADEKEEKDS